MEPKGANTTEQVRQSLYLIIESNVNMKSGSSRIMYSMDNVQHILNICEITSDQKDKCRIESEIEISTFSTALKYIN